MMKFLALLSSLVIVTNAAVLPPFLTRCSKSGNLNACIRSNIESARPFIADGFPELSIPSLKKILIPYSFANITNFEFGVWNYNVIGLDDFQILDVDADVISNEFTVRCLVPYVEGHGQYGVKGRLFNLDLDSTGEVRINATNLYITVTVKTDIVERNGNYYMHTVSINSNMRMPDGILYINMANLYLGNTEITDIMNRIFNENSYYVYEVIHPILLNQLVLLLEKALDKLFVTYTYSELLAP